MYCETTAPHVSASGQGHVSLRGVDVRVQVVDYLARTTMSYWFSNTENVNTEVVYTFPLPVDGVLTRLTVRIGDKELTGRAVEKAQAQERYEDAVSTGDTPILLERLDSGLFALNFGNLLPGETACVEVEFTEVLALKDGAVRYDLPTTLAPWYGDPAHRGLAQHHVPEHSLLADNTFHFSAQISGCLRRAAVSCPTHGMSVRMEDETVHVSLAKELALMDRDLVLVLSGESLPSAFAVAAPVIGPDETEEFVVMSGFTAHFSTPEPARSIKLVVDCSGSMNGESMQQAREAVLRILERLRPEDHFNLIRFGSSSEALFTRQSPADEEHLDAARAAVRGMSASMGGTELERALRRAQGSVSPKGMPEDILLITDGQVWEINKVAQELRSAGHRVYCIGVGSAVSAGVLQTLSAQTGGESILVSPNEDMGRQVFAQFKRMISGAASQSELLLDGLEAREQLYAPVPDVYAGDMVVTWTKCVTLPSQVSLRVQAPDGTKTVDAFVRVNPALSELLPRLAAAAKLDSLKPKEATALAVSHNLVSVYTHYLVVLERAEGHKADDFPALRTVTHVVPRGWGGLGGVFSAVEACGMPSIVGSMPAYIRTRCTFSPCHSYSAPLMPLYIPWAEQVLRQAEAMLHAHPEHEITYADLRAWGVPEAVIADLQALAGQSELLPKKTSAAGSELENLIGQTFLLALAKEETSGRNHVRVFRRARGRLPQAARLTEAVTRLVCAKGTP